MSIRAGKQKDWGSRSGRNRDKSRDSFSDLDRLYYQGLSRDLLELVENDPERFLALANQQVQGRRKITSDADVTPLSREFKTDLGTLYKGDCIKLMGDEIEDNSLDCIFADPPFNLAKDYGKSVSDQAKDEEYLEWTRVWLDLCCDKLKEGGSLFVYNIPKWATFIANYLNQRLSFRHWIAVDLTLSMPIPSKLYPSHYALLYFVKGKKPRHFSPPRTSLKTCVRCGQEQNDYGGYKKKMNPNGLNLRDIWTDIPPVRHGKHKNRDANELSLKLLDRVLDIATEEGDLVFDPFGGGGTTYVAAELTGRRWIGVELGDTRPIVDRLSDLEGERERLAKYHSTQNTLFTDRDIKNRHKHGLRLDNFNIQKEQIDYVLNRIQH